MAGCRLAVIPMKKGLLHSGGQQTYLNAMAMGKPVIVVDDFGAKDYIEHGVNGLIVPSGESETLRTAIKSIISDPRFEEKLGCNALKTYNTYSTTKCMERILEAAREVFLEPLNEKSEKAKF